MLVTGRSNENFWFLWAQKITSFIRKIQGAQVRNHPEVPLNEPFPQTYGCDDAFSGERKSHGPYLFPCIVQS